MSDAFQLPLTPFGTTGLSPMYGGTLAPTRSPFYSISNQFLPRNLHDVIKWSRYITMHSPTTTEVLRKHATYPITEFVIDTNEAGLREKYETLLEDLDLRSALHDVGFEYHTIGNVFISIYFPVIRSLKCPKCGTVIHTGTTNTWAFKNYKFTATCPNTRCQFHGGMEHHDVRDVDPKKMNIIKWDPTHIVVNHNPITNGYEYYYKLPNEIKRKIQLGDPLYISSLPWEFIEAAKQNKDFKFSNNSIFHLRNLSTGQMVEGISVPPLISLFSTIFYQATLRRANESVAQDYMSPLRIVYPSAQTGNSDPVISLSMANFTANMEKALVAHKRDNNNVLIAPVPVGYQAVSGEGKSLLVTQEIREAEEAVLLSLGVSRELLSGTTNWTSSTVGLRMLENSMQTYARQITRLMQWIVRKCTSYLTWKYVDVSLTPFKLTDNDQLKEVLMSGLNAGKVSMHTLFEAFNLDYEEEIRKVKDENIAMAVMAEETKFETERAVFLAMRKASQEFDKGGEYKTALDKAQAQAEQLFQTDEGTKRSYLNALKSEDYAMYLMVSKLLEEYNRANSAAANVETAQAVAQTDAPGESQVPADTATEQASSAPTPTTPKSI